MKRHLAIVSLVVLSMGAGCMGMTSPDLGFGLGVGDQDQTNTTYDWNTSTNATLTLQSDKYQSVYELGNDKLELYTHGPVGSERALDVRAVKYRYPNETVVTTDHSDLSVDKSNSRTVIQAPSDDGQIAFVTDKRPKSVTTPVFLESDDPSYEIVLPPNMDIDVPILGTASPGGYETNTEDGRVHIVWDAVSGSSVSVQYYLVRDLYIFGAVLGIGLLGGLAGVGYYLLQIRQLKQLRQRIEVDADIDTGNDQQ
ncbi:DUF5803 family protein [Halocatena salina]|uniref:DUF5803 family protein n=1 Tax=Halocatena salina TaxID=2934340 RepID=A0A8T9ZYQ1_9EURY|nr:DUF5803 family protein [Halocatena salina]UPM41794.1 DUF5803 family protein [Halocatena salina]